MQFASIGKILGFFSIVYIVIYHILFYRIFVNVLGLISKILLRATKIKSRIQLVASGNCLMTLSAKMICVFQI